MFFIRFTSLLLLSTAGVLAAANPPPSVSASAASCSSVTVSWEAAGGTGGNSPNQYEIFRDAETTRIGTVAASVRTFTDANAGANSTHSYGVRTLANNGSMSTVTWSGSVSTGSQCPLGAPGNLSGSAPSCSQINLSWTAPADTGAGLVGYRIYRNNIYISQVTGLSYGNTGLAANTSYTYDVSALDAIGRESAKSRITVMTPGCQGQTPPAGPPGNASLSVEGKNGVINWPGSAGVRYQVERSTDFGISWTPVDAPTTTLTVTNVRVGAAGVFRVAWFTNTTEYRNNYALFSSDTTAPTPIATASLTELAGGQVRIDWSGSSDSQSGLKGYLLYRDNTFLAFAPGSATSYTDATGEGSGSEYDVAAMDRAGNVTAKVRPGCSFGLSSSSWAATACGGGTSVYVSTSRANCSWSATSPCAWLSVSPAGASGSGWVTVTADSNTSGSTRSCNLTIAGQTFSVSQAACGSACSYTVSPGSSSFGYSGGSGSFIVYTTSSCSRTATPSAAWITITGGGSGTGNGTVSFSVTANTGAARSGTITISGTGTSQTYTVYQDAAPTCSYSLTPTNVYFSSAAASGSSIVTAGSGCGWTATSLDNWVVITGGGSGAGSGSVSYSVYSNPSVALNRVGRIQVVGGSTTLTLVINQDRNYAPVANAGANSSAAVGASVVMDGSASTDEDGTIVSYSWNYGDGTTGSGVSGSHAYAAAGSYTVTLTATDDLGASSSASKVVTVSTPTGTPGELQFVRTVSSPTGLHVFSRGTAGDHAGNSVLVGYFTGSADFGNGTVTAGGSADAYIAKYDSQGRLLWALTTPSSLDQAGYGVAIDSADNILVTGYFYGTVDFGGTILTSAGSADIFLAKYSPSGALVWVKRFGTGATDMGYGVAVDGNNNAVVIGYFQGTGDFGSYSLTSAGSSVDIALFKVSATGSVTWAKRYGGNYTEYPNAIAIDTAGDIAITGQAGIGGASIDLGGGAISGSGIFVAKYSGATGNHVWSKVLGGNAGYGIACDPNTRNVIVTGAFQGTVNFGGGPQAPGAGGGQTMFLAGYSPSGNFLWVNTWGGLVSTSYDQGMSLKINLSGELALTGGITSPIDFGSGQLFGGGYFVAAFSVSGNSAPVNRWAKRSTGFGAAFGYCCDFDSAGNILTSGYFNSTVDFGGLSVTAYGANNAFLCRYAP